MKPIFVGKAFFACGMSLLLTMGSCLTARGQDNDARPPSPDDSVHSLLPLTAYVGAEIRTCDEAGTIPNGVVLVQAGKILAVGDAELEIPARAERIDVSGMVLTPGLIDARSVLWLNNPSADSGASDASLNIAYEVDPFAEDWHEVIRHGVTAVYVQPSRRGSLSGYGAVLSVLPAAEGPSMLAEHVALQAAMGVGASSNRTRQQQLDRTKKVLQAAAEYQKQIKEYDEYQEKQASKKKSADDAKKTSEKKLDKDKKDGPSNDAEKTTGRPEQAEKGSAEGKTGTPATDASKSADEADKKSASSKSDPKPPKKPDHDPIKERLVKVLEGQIPLRLEIHTADDAAFAEQLLDDEAFERIQVIYEGLSDLRSAYPGIVDSNAPVVLGPWLSAEPLYDRASGSQSNWGMKFGDYPGAAIIATYASSPRGSRFLRAHAAMAVRHGFAADRALKAITIDAARALGVADQVGSIAAGKRADLVCFDGEPIDPSSTVKLVVSGGEIAHQDKSQAVESAAAELVEADIGVLPSAAAGKLLSAEFALFRGWQVTIRDHHRRRRQDHRSLPWRGRASGRPASFQLGRCGHYARPVQWACNIRA